MTRQTSLEAYEKIQESGLLGRRQWQFYDIIYRHGPITVADACDFLKREFNVELSAFGPGPRFTELVRYGVIQEVDSVLDPRTKMKVLLYDVTSNIPDKKNEWKKSKNEIIRELNDELTRAKSLLARCTCRIQDELPF